MNRLFYLHPLRSMAAAGCIVVGLLLLAAPHAQAQLFPSERLFKIYVERTGSQNPFNGVTISTINIAPAFVDHDGDGDLDLVIGEDFNSFQYYRNDGNLTFTGLTGANNPYNGINQFTNHIAFIDYDGDNDLDVAVTDVFFGSPGLVYYRNDNGTFNQQTGSNNPFGHVDGSGRPVPFFADYDGDGDEDLIVGTANNNGIRYYRNDSGTFNQQTGSNNPFNSVSSIGANHTQLFPTLADLDDDGDFDLLYGGPLSLAGHYQQDSNLDTLHAQFTIQNSSPFLSLLTKDNSTPAFADLDGDGDLDLIVGEFDGSSSKIRYFENVNITTTLRFEEQIGSNNPVSATLNVGAYASPAFIDLDSDNDLDLVVTYANGTGELKYYENAGGVFTEVTGANNPFNHLADPVSGSYNLGSSPRIDFGDVDGDSDLDMVIGLVDGTIHYYEYDNAQFTRLTGSANPFNTFDVGGFATPTLVDINGDGHIDLMVGNDQGTFTYFQNNAGTYTLVTGSSHPLDGIDIGTLAAVTFYDLDGDNDLDAVIGGNTSNDRLQLYLNDNGNFVLQSLGEDPFHFLRRLENATRPAFIDFDQDGDVDILTGSEDGIFQYFENLGSALPVEFLHFKGHAMAQGNALQWATATEDNNEGFYVQRSSDGRRFDDIEWVAGAGTTQEVQSYALLDREPLNGVNYYRLKQVDYDGTFAYSKVISLYQQATAGEDAPFAYPNPTRDFLTIEAPTASLATLFNALGQPIKQISLAGSTRTLDVSDLPKGLYALQLQATDGTILHTQQVVKL